MFSPAKYKQTYGICFPEQCICSCAQTQKWHEFSYVLLTVHLSLILTIDQLNSCFLIILIYSSTCFEHCCFIIRKSNCIILHLVSSHSVGGRPVHGTATLCYEVTQIVTVFHIFQLVLICHNLSPLSTCAPDGHLQVWW